MENAHSKKRLTGKEFISITVIKDSESGGTTIESSVMGLEEQPLVNFSLFKIFNHSHGFS